MAAAETPAWEEVTTAENNINTLIRSPWDIPCAKPASTDIYTSKKNKTGKPGEATEMLRKRKTVEEGKAGHWVL